jgi:hypothetical protein
MKLYLVKHRDKVTFTFTLAGQPGFGGSILGGGWEFVSSPPCPYRLWGPHSLLSSGFQCTFPKLKRRGREAHYTPPSGAEVKKEWRVVTHSDQLLHILL